MSNIRLFVTYGDKGAVFAGEKLECTITFKNVAHVPYAPRAGNHGAGNGMNGNASGGGTHSPMFSERRSKQPPLQLSASDKARGSLLSPRIPPSAGRGKGHRPSLSLSMPTRRSRSVTSMGTAAMDSAGLTPKSGTITPNEANQAHKRSISIMSIGSEQGPDGTTPAASCPARRGAPHSRSASLQYLPRRSPGVPPNGSATPNSATLQRNHPSTATHIIEDSLSGFAFPSPKRSPSTPRHNATGSFNKQFKFPSQPNTPASASSTQPQQPKSAKARQQSSESLLAAGVTNVDLTSPLDDSNSEFEHVPPSRVLSDKFVEDTPRSSSEFYTLSNGTTDTISSEMSSRHARPAHSRRQSLLSMVSSPKPPPSDVLMMGYAQVLGSFTIEGSLVQSSAFEEVKRKGVVSGQMGGGVVGIERGRNENGFLSGFGWGSISSGLTGLLGGNNMSSIAEMKNIASSKSIPILSTPQSILFVDLKLAPGESRSYTYTFTLPRGLPPSHRGKAIKIVYNLVIGAQRPGKGVQPKVIEVPFRVFSHVGANGYMSTHDLMSPYVLLKDEATTTCVEENKLAKRINLVSNTPKPTSDDATLEDFLGYVDKLLAQRDSQFSPNPTGLLSPSASSSRRTSFIVPEEPTSKEAIDFAVLGLAGQRGMSRVYEIARSGKRVASLTLGRPAYKLGECVLAVIDFTDAQIPCYQLHATLETHETVNPSIALRSASSIYRVTRKVHAQHSESCLYAKRVTFVPNIPVSGTPEFETSGVSCKWSLRLEFITPVLPHHTNQPRPSDYDSDDSDADRTVDLLEETHSDERGQLFSAVPQLSCDTFDCNIPVKVFANEVGPATGVHPTSGWVV